MSIYELINEKYNSLIKENKFEDALKLLEDEINSSFIIQPYYDDWNNKIKNLKQIIYSNDKEKKINDFTKKLKKSDLISYIVKDGKIDFNFLNLYLQKFIEIDNDQIKVLQFLFTNKNILQEDKFKLFSILLANTSNKNNFLFLNSIINKDKEIDDNVLNNLNLNIKKCSDLLNELSNKEITNYQLSIQILNLLNVYYFPFSPEEILKISSEKLTKEIYKFVKNSLSNKENNSKIIKKVLKYFENNR